VLGEVNMSTANYNVWLFRCIYEDSSVTMDCRICNYKAVCAIYREKMDC